MQRTLRVWEEESVQWQPFVLPLLALLMFNLGQYETWLQGFQTLMLLEMTGIVVGFFVLVEDKSWRGLGISVLLGIVAVFSMGNGLLYWMVGLLILFVSLEKGGTGRIKLAVWLAAGLICAAVFLRDWHSKRLDLAYLVNDLPGYLVFILNFIGSPVNPSAGFAWVFGCMGLGLFLLFIGYLLKTRIWRPFLPYLAIAVFVLISGAAISAGRLNLGMEQARVSRYHTLSILFWGSLLVLLPAIRIRGIYKTIIYVILTLFLTRLMFTGYVNGQIGIYQRILPAYEALKSGEEPGDEMLLLVYPDLDRVRGYLAFLSDQGLSVYAEVP